MQYRQSHPERAFKKGDSHGKRNLLKSLFLKKYTIRTYRALYPQSLEMYMCELKSCQVCNQHYFFPEREPPRLRVLKLADF